MVRRASVCVPPRPPTRKIIYSVNLNFLLAYWPSVVDILPLQGQKPRCRSIVLGQKQLEFARMDSPPVVEQSADLLAPERDKPSEVRGIT